RVTRGVLQGTVETEVAKETVQHRLVVSAPAYNAYRHTLIVVQHNVHLAYPAVVRAEALAEREQIYSSVAILGQPTHKTVYPSAFDDEQLKRLVAKALRSDQTRAVILSLIAKSNEAQASSAAGARDALNHYSQQDETTSGPDSSPPESPNAGAG